MPPPFIERSQSYANLQSQVPDGTWQSQVPDGTWQSANHPVKSLMMTRELFYPIFSHGGIYLFTSGIIFPNKPDSRTNYRSIVTPRKKLPSLRDGIAESLKMNASPLLARLHPDVFKMGPLYLFQPPPGVDQTASTPAFLIPVPESSLNFVPVVNVFPSEKSLDVKIDACGKRPISYSIVASTGRGAATKVTLDQFTPVNDYARCTVPPNYSIFFNLGDPQIPIMGISIGPDASKGIDVAIDTPIIEEVRCI